MRIKYHIASLVLIIFTQEISSYNILISHPFYAGSHVLTLHKVAESLIERGHRVTTLRFADSHGFNFKELGANHTDIQLTINNTDGQLALISREDGRFVTPNGFFWDHGLDWKGLFLTPDNAISLSKAYCRTLLTNTSLLLSLKEEHFDLAIIDILNNQAGLVLTHHLKIPSKVAFWAFSFVSGECEFCQVSLPSSYIPVFLTEYTHEMNLFQRIVNFAYKHFLWGSFSFLFYNLMDQYIQELLPESRLHSLDMIAQLNGVIINSDDVLDYPRLRGSTVLNVGGLQISKVIPPLSHDLANWMNEAKDGVILISLGFVFGFEGVPEDRIQTIIQSFAHLKQRVIFKFDAEIKNLPSNVMILPFVPQQSILSHPNMVLFFTHCGMHGVMEAIYFGVPMVGLPIFVDQGDVCSKVEYRGIGKRVSKTSSSSEIQNTVKEVLNDPKYRANIDRSSKIFRLRRTHPMDDVMWLTEYLIQTNGSAHHLPQGQKLNFIVYHSLDVLCIFILCITISIKFLINAISSKRAFEIRPTSS
ncbi:UDP-glucuronosyltransferase 2B16 [Lepeophtheirus salmonis]|uniref:UDP-glucuronosyltransferase 2B16 n=1 Tax=Lepeophtheirus salmonis TaxID=72036 RepID=UPI001AE0FE20|nr:UDP-glucuronosyltransferase 2B16-like [Lepeophtheirus salmonis]